jgi:hypothetical protein
LFSSLSFADITCCAAGSRANGGSCGHGSDHVPINQTPNEPAGCTGSGAGSCASGGTTGPAGNDSQAAEEDNNNYDISLKVTIFKYI